jgi:hypothetical protein
MQLSPAVAAAEQTAPGVSAPVVIEPIATNQAATNQASTNATKAPYKIPEGRIMEFFIPLSPAVQLTIANAKNPPVDRAKVAIAVPPGFDPDVPSTIFLVNGTSDGDGSSIRMMPAFTNIALRLGCVVIAADGPNGRPPNDNPPWRWAMISALFDHLYKTWPQSRKWPIICAGFSGGGKWAGVIGAILAEKKYNLIGVFMSSVNQDYASEAAKLYKPAVRYHRVPIFISSGTEDKIAPPQANREVMESMVNNGFAKVRLESFTGGAALSETALRTAINWFVEQYAMAPAK